jgi:hypothetical protein
MSAPARFPNGVTNSSKASAMNMLPVLDPTKVHMFFDDFDRYVAADWTITTTEGGASDATEALADADGGVLTITNDAADNDNDFFQKVGESFKLESGKKAWFKSRFKVSDATQSDFVMGLQITDTSPLAVSDGIYFRKDDGDALLDFVVMKDSSATTATGVHTVVDDTYLVVGFYYNGVDAIEYYIDDVKIGTSVTTNHPDDTELTISFGIQNGEAAAKVMSVDYILAAKER